MGHAHDLVDVLAGWLQSSEPPRLIDVLSRARCGTARVARTAGAMNRAPSVAILDVNETLSDLAPLAGRFEDVGAPGDLLGTWFAATLRDGIALAASGQYAAFPEVARGALRPLLARVGGLGPRLEEAAEHVVAGIGTLSVHPDVEPGLRRMRDAGLRIATLTNGSAAATEALLERPASRTWSSGTSTCRTSPAGSRRPSPTGTPAARSASRPAPPCRSPSIPGTFTAPGAPGCAAPGSTVTEIPVASLLPQPYGFEGLRLPRVELRVDDQPVPEGEDHRVLPRGYVDARVVPAHPLAEQPDYAVPGFDQLVLDLDGFPGREPLSPPPKRGLYSPVDPGEVRHRMSRGIPFDFRIPELDPGPRERGFPVELARISAKGLDGRPQQLHVRLRHRPPSIAFDPGSANGERRAKPPRREGRRLRAGGRPLAAPRSC